MSVKKNDKITKRLQYMIVTESDTGRIVDLVQALNTYAVLLSDGIIRGLPDSE